MSCWWYFVGGKHNRRPAIVLSQHAFRKIIITIHYVMHDKKAFSLLFCFVSSFMLNVNKFKITIKNSIPKIVGSCSVIEFQAQWITKIGQQDWIKITNVKIRYQHLPTHLWYTTSPQFYVRSISWMYVERLVHITLQKEYFLYIKSVKKIFTLSKWKWWLRDFTVCRKGSR